MTDHWHAVVWLDSDTARIFRFDAQDIDKSRVRADEPDREAPIARAMSAKARAATIANISSGSSPSSSTSISG